MKRNGFVSNSSSTSFIVAVEPDKKGSDEPIRPKFKMTIEVDLCDFTQATVSTLEDLAARAKDHYLSEEQVKECEKAIRDGKIVMIGEFNDFSEGGNQISSILCQRGLKKSDVPGGVIIYTQKGY